MDQYHNVRRDPLKYIGNDVYVKKKYLTKHVYVKSLRHKEKFIIIRRGIHKESLIINNGKYLLGPWVEIA